MFRRAFCLCFIVLILPSCGESIDVYNWVRLRVFPHDRSIVKDVPEDGTIQLDNYSIRLDFTPESLISVRSSDWVSASSSFKANDKIALLEIRSVNSINESIGSGELLNDMFEAGPVGAINSDLRPVDIFISEFGTKSGEIDQEFVLYLKPGLTVNTDIIQFEISINMESGASFRAKTDQVFLDR